MANIMLDGIGAPALGASVGLREPGGHPRPALATRDWFRSQSQVKTWNAQAAAGFIPALLGALTSFVPIVNVAGDFLAFLGLIFAVIALIKARSRGAGTGSVHGGDHPGSGCVRHLRRDERCRSCSARQHGHERQGRTGRDDLPFSLTIEVGLGSRPERQMPAGGVCRLYR